jgi:hypothetical protein
MDTLETYHQCHQLSGGKVGLRVVARDGLSLRPILLQRGCRGPIKVREGPCKSGQKMRKWLERAKARKRREKRTVKSVLQSKEARVELAILSAPNAEIVVMLLAVKLPKRFQLIDLSIAALDFGFQRCAKLVYLALILYGEDFMLFGQLVVKLQPQLRFRLSSFRQLCFQLLGLGGLGLQTLELLRMLLLE